MISAEPAVLSTETTRHMWLVAILGALLVAIYWPTLARTTELLVFSDDMAHGFFAPIVAMYVVWYKRSVAFSAAAQPTGWGILVLAIAAVGGMIAALGESTTLSRFAFLLSLVGCLMLVGGLHAVRVLIFPLGLLLFTFPLPEVLYGDLTLPLQLLATRLSESALETLGYSVLREGNILNLPHQRLSVVEACSGIRSLVTLTFACVVYAYFFGERWLKVLIVLAAIPAAILLNAARITVTGMLGERAPSLTQGIYHEMLGWGCFVAAFGVVFVFHRILRTVLGLQHKNV